MDTRILEIVFYLMDHLQEGDEQLSHLPDYSMDLKSLGYLDDEISSAYGWILDHLSSASDNLYTAFPTEQSSVRILSESERYRLSPESHAYLLRLLNFGLMNREQQERILDRLSLFSSRVTTVEQIKLIASAILFDEYDRLETVAATEGGADHASQVN